MTDTMQNNSNANKDPAKLEREVNAARARLSQSVDALGSKLSPGELVDQALGMAREHGGDFAKNLGTQAKQNPVPLLLTGVGIAWLMSADNSTDGEQSLYDDETSYGEQSFDSRTAGNTGSNWSASDSDDSEEGIGNKIKGKLTGAKDAVGQHASGTAASMKSGLQSTQGSMQSARRGARRQTQRMQENLTQLMDEQPLLCGALGVALGASLGALLPYSQKEDEMFGSASDSAKDDAQQYASKQYDKARETAKDKAEEVKKASGENKPAKQTGRSQPETAL